MCWLEKSVLSSLADTYADFSFWLLLIALPFRGGQFVVPEPEDRARRTSRVFRRVR